MYNSLRRKMLFWMVALPVVGKGIAKGSVFGTASSPRPTKDALDAIRLFNTIQVTHKHKNKSYASAADLNESFSRLETSNDSATAPKKKSCLDLEGAELIRGWSYSLHLSPGKDDYLFVMKSGQQVMACGDPGVIYHGKVAADVSLPDSYVPVSKLWPNVLSTLSPAAVVEMVNPSRTGSVLRRVAFMNMNASSAFVHCGCNCSSSWVWDLCWTVGFPDCIYCCCASASSCCLDSSTNGEQCAACRCIGCGCIPCHN